MVNLVILVGRLGRKPELAYTPEGTPVVDFSLATESKYKGDNGITTTATQWHRIRGWGAVAEACNAYLDVGRLVYIRGHLLTVRYEQNKVKVSKTYVIVDEIKFLPTSKSEARQAFVEEDLPADLGQGTAV